MREEMRVRIDVSRLARALRDAGYTVISVEELAKYLGVSNKQAGKILARMARLGYARKISRYTYRIG